MANNNDEPVELDQVDAFLATVASGAQGVTIRRQGSLAAEEPLPDPLITYWVNSTEDHAHYDNAAFGCVWDFDVNVYGRDPSTVYSTMDGIRTALLAAGYVIDGKGSDTTSDEADIVGRTISAQYLEIEKQTT